MYEYNGRDVICIADNKVVLHIPNFAWENEKLIGIDYMTFTNELLMRLKDYVSGLF